MSDKIFTLSNTFAPAGDQPEAIKKILSFFASKEKHSALLGVTGSGKTFTMAHVLAELGRPALVVAPNKTLAAQLFSELKELFPKNSVEYFISYYDYYQPEAYVPSSDTYIAKDSAINEDIDKMRHAATMALFERRDVIIVASVSCIYGLGSPESYSNLVVTLEVNQKMSRQDLLYKLVDIQYSREDGLITRGKFRARGDTVDIMPSHQRDEAIRIEFSDDHITDIKLIDPLTGKTLRAINHISIYPNSHYVTDRKDMGAIVREILTDLGIRLRELKAIGKFVEYQRLEQRTMHDIELLEHIGFCPGIENYSRYLSGVPAGHPPPTLLDYFPKDFITIVDESHITVPQFGGMYRGDRARKQVLVDFGFRLPSALDNRPLNFVEFMERTGQVLYVSATPGPYELEKSQSRIAEQIIRPTGLVDPMIEIKPVTGQVDDLYTEIRKTTEKRERVLIVTLTKQMAEDLTTYYKDMNIRARYLHSDIESLDRIDLLRDLRKGEFDVLIGINLLREGLDLPEVSLVAVMDADKEGFLRSKNSLIQIVGRAARNSGGRVIFYGDRCTDSMRGCIDETNRRRDVQLRYNFENNITPQTIIKAIPENMRKLYGIVDVYDDPVAEMTEKLKKEIAGKSLDQIEKLIVKKSKQMKKFANDLAFEDATNARDEIRRLKEILLVLSGTTTENLALQ